MPLRSLLLSDLHLGARGAKAVLHDPGCRRVLGEAIAGAERVVLLGDVLELRERPLRDVLPDATPALAAIAGSAAAGATREIVLLCGNHDHRLLEPWLRRRDRARPIALDAEVTPAPGDPLAEVVSILAGGREGTAARVRVRVRHPGAWLEDGVWATHGHLGDRHTTLPILERLGAGAMARIAGARDPRGVEDYEAALAPMYAWIDALAEHSRRARDLEGSEAAWLALSRPGGGLRGRALRAAFPLVIAAANRAGLGPLRADLSREALREAPLAAMGEVLPRLGVPARWVLFGHTHRAGPLTGEAPAQWTTPAGARLLNTGCWVRERGLLGPDRARSPYRPGWAVWLDGDPARAPELFNLLD